MPLSDEEIAELRAAGPEGLAGAVAAAQNAYHQATDADRAGLERRYFLLLNLAAKTAPFSGPTASPQEIERLEEWNRARRALEEPTRHLSESERDAAIAKAKYVFFRPGRSK